jgi:polysaccharide biosynthesis transport protein
MFRSNDFEVRDLGRVLSRRRGAITLSILGFLALALVLNVVTRPVFRTAARLTIHPTQSRSPLTNAAVENPTTVSEHLSLLTTAERIMSRDVLERVAREMQVRAIPLGPTAAEGNAKAPSRATASASLEPVLPASVAEAQLRSDVEWLAKNVTVRPIRDTRLVDVNAEHSDAHAAAEIANAVANLFVKNESQLRRSADADRLTALRVQIEDLRRVIQNSEQALYGSQNATLALAGERSKQLTSAASELSSSSIKTRADLRVVESQLARIRAFRREASPNWANPPVQTDALDRLYGQLQTAETEIGALKRQYREQSVEVAQAEAQAQALREAMRRELQKAYSDLEGQRDVLAARVDGIDQATARNEHALKALSDSSYKYSTLESELNTQRDLYTLLLKKVQEQDIAQTIQPATVEVVQLAPVPLQRVRPRKLLNVAIGLVLGTIFGVGLALTLEALRRTIRSPRDVVNELQLPVMGMIPKRL